MLIHDESGYQALSLVCPHLGCTVEPKPDGFICPCHGSKFKPGGAVERGPADKDLLSLKVVQAPDGRLTLFTT
jgi:Rieske Fe-S protein